VALLENSIGPRLLLATRLSEVGYTVTVLSAADAVREQMNTGTLDWLILDETAMRRDGTALLGHLARTRERPRIAWLGAHPPASKIPIDVSFDKPLDYGKVIRFLSATSDE
jgi:DNA-binding response OmpR family regulator